MPPRKKKRKTRKTKKRGTPRVQVPRICDAGLAQLLGADRLTLGDAVKRLWARAKERGLQEGKTIRCDGSMRRLFGVPQLSMFEVSGALSAHLTGAGPSSSSVNTASRLVLVKSEITNEHERTIHEHTCS